METKNCYLSEMHLFKTNDAHFVFQPLTLRLYEVDKDTYGILNDYKEKYGLEKPFICEDEELITAGIIYHADEPIGDPMQKRFEKAKEEAESDSSRTEKLTPVVSTVLQIANDCNLNCIYCYGDGGSYGRQRELMTLDTAKKAIDLMVENSGDAEKLVVIFFGGEPLINFEVVKGALEYCKSLEATTGKKFQYSMTTNGTILNDEIFNFIKDNKVSVMISMDGGADIQNKHRCYCDGRGSFEDIKKNIERFKEARGGHLTARATVCSTDIRFKKIKDDLLALGFTNAITSMVDTSEDSPLFVGGEKNTAAILEQYQILANDFVECVMNGKRGGNNLIANTLDRLYFKKMKIRACNAGGGGIAVGTDGNIYPCHRFMGMPEYIIGNLTEGIDEEKRGSYQEATIYNKEGCRDCWARYLCSGGCGHTCAAHGGDVYHAPDCYCDIYRGLHEIILHAYWKLKEWDDDIFRKTLEKSDKQVNTL